MEGKMLALKPGFIRIALLSLSIIASIPMHAEEVLPLSEQPTLDSSPFRLGERLIFKAKVLGIPAGWQILQTLSVERIDGRDVIHVKSTSQTNDFFSKIYYFRDSRESYIDPEAFRPILYKKEIVDRKFRAHVEIDFDSDDGIAVMKEKGKTMRIEVPPDVQDELSMLFLVRAKAIEPGKPYAFPLLLRKKVRMITVRMTGAETVKTVLGKVRTIVLCSSSGHKLWLTDDDRRIPVKIEARTKLGKIVGILEKVN